MGPRYIGTKFESMFIYYTGGQNQKMNVDTNTIPYSSQYEYASVIRVHKYKYHSSLAIATSDQRRSDAAHCSLDR